MNSRIPMERVERVKDIFVLVAGDRGTLSATVRLIVKSAVYAYLLT